MFPLEHRRVLHADTLRQLFHGHVILLPQKPDVIHCAPPFIFLETLGQTWYIVLVVTAREGGETMDKAALKAELDAALKNFVNETKHFDDYSQAPVTEGELKEVVKQVYYVLDAFRDSLLKHLD